MKTYNNNGELLVQTNDISLLAAKIADAISKSIIGDVTNMALRVNIVTMGAIPWTGTPTVTITTGTLATVTNLVQMDGVALKPTIILESNLSAWKNIIRNLIS